MAWYQLLVCARSFPEKPGICLRLEIVIFVSSKDVAICQLNYLQQYESRGQSVCI